MISKEKLNPPLKELYGLLSDLDRFSIMIGLVEDNEYYLAAGIDIYTGGVRPREWLYHEPPAMLKFAGPDGDKEWNIFTTTGAIF